MFKNMIECNEDVESSNASGMQQNASITTTSLKKRRRLHIPVASQDLRAAQLVLHALYDAQVFDKSDGLPPELLASCIRLADQWQADAVLQAAANRLHTGAVLGHWTWATSMAVLDLPPTLSGNAHAAGLVDHARLHVVEQLANLESTWSQEDLRSKWLQLPIDAVQWLLESDLLQVSSENTVFMALSEYVERGRGRSGEPCQLGQLLESLRLQHISTSYFYSIMLSRPWVATAAAAWKLPLQSSASTADTSTSTNSPNSTTSVQQTSSSSLLSSASLQETPRYASGSTWITPDGHHDRSEIGLASNVSPRRSARSHLPTPPSSRTSQHGSVEQKPIQPECTPAVQSSTNSDQCSVVDGIASLLALSAQYAMAHLQKDDAMSSIIPGCSMLMPPTEQPRKAADHSSCGVIIAEVPLSQIRSHMQALNPGPSPRASPYARTPYNSAHSNVTDAYAARAPSPLRAGLNRHVASLASGDVLASRVSSFSSTLRSTMLSARIVGTNSNGSSPPRHGAGSMENFTAHMRSDPDHMGLDLTGFDQIPQHGSEGNSASSPNLIPSTPTCIWAGYVWALDVFIARDPSVVLGVSVHALYPALGLPASPEISHQQQDIPSVASFTGISNSMASTSITATAATSRPARHATGGAGMVNNQQGRVNMNGVASNGRDFPFHTGHIIPGTMSAQAWDGAGNAQSLANLVHPLPPSMVPAAQTLSPLRSFTHHNNNNYIAPPWSARRAHNAHHDDWPASGMSLHGPRQHTMSLDERLHNLFETGVAGSASPVRRAVHVEHAEPAANRSNAKSPSTPAAVQHGQHHHEGFDPVPSQQSQQTADMGSTGMGSFPAVPQPPRMPVSGNAKFVVPARIKLFVWDDALHRWDDLYSQVLASQSGIEVLLHASSPEDHERSGGAAGTNDTPAHADRYKVFYTDYFAVLGGSGLESLVNDPTSWQRGAYAPQGRMKIKAQLVSLG